MARARDRSDQFGQQSEQISEISRDARHKVEKLEALAGQNKQNAVEANEKATAAYDLAKNTLSQQQNIRLIIHLSKLMYTINSASIIYLAFTATNCGQISATRSSNPKRHWKRPHVYRLMLSNAPMKCMTRHSHCLPT